MSKTNFKQEYFKQISKLIFNETQGMLSLITQNELGN